MQYSSGLAANKPIDATGLIDAAFDQPARSRVQVLTEVEQAETIWRELVNQGAVYSRYQHYSWMSRWWQHIGSRMGVDPHLVVLRDEAERVILFLPLVRRQFGPLKVGMFMGGKHANFNLPIWRPQYLGDPSAATKTLMNGLKGAGGPLDVLLLFNQPQSWQGEANPMLVLPHRPSASRAYSGELRRDFEGLLKDRMGGTSRKKLRQKVRMLGGADIVSSRRARTPDEIAHVLAAFFDQKRARMQELGLCNVFDSPGVREFITSAASGIDPDSGDSIIELYATFVGDEIVATFGGISAHGRFSGMFNSMTDGHFREHSPGELLLTNVVRMCCERGMERFDLGVGDAGYKQVFCDQVETLYDSIVPLTAAGRVAIPVFRWGLALKAAAKNSQAVMNAKNFIQNYLTRTPR